MKSIQQDKIGIFRRNLGKRWRNVLDVGLATGWRISDILGLRVDDLGRGGVVSMVAKKTGKAASAILPKPLARRIRAFSGQWWLFPSPVDPVYPVTRQAAYKAFKRASERSGLSLVSPHSMRRTYAQALYRDGASFAAIQAALQHDRLETSLLYLLDDVGTRKTSPTPLKSRN